MAMTILAGGACMGVRRIEKADSISVFVSSAARTPSRLLVEERGDIRSLPISRDVAEVLIAHDLPYGD